MERLFFTVGGVSGMMAVALGAFGAHVLKARLSADLLATFETAVRYHMYHAIALFLAAVANVMWPYSLRPEWAGWAFIAGTVLFSGSLYGRVFLRVRALGMLAPLGGVAFMAGWLFLGLSPWW